MNLRDKSILASIVFLSLRFSAFGVDSIHYAISLANPAQHLVQVTIEIPPGKDERELQLPVWNALYQIRDFSQYINWIRLAGSNGAVLTQSDKSRWKITHAENGATVEYQIFADNPGSYGAQLDSHHAFFNLAEILLYIGDERSSPVEVVVDQVPAEWRVATSLPQQGTAFRAANYDQLVDSPVEIGTFTEASFASSCGKYRVIVDADSAQAILNQIVPPVKRTVSTATTWMSDCPFHNYTFIYHFMDSPGSGGMEHAYSTAITLPVRYLNENFDLFKSITAHEFFHLWNVKRIRPQSLEPIDYTKENYTPALWFSEGVDSTVADYLLIRAGLLDEHGFLNRLSDQITELEDRPAHLTQSAEQSSLDAWLEKYPYYNLPSRSISYYNKGELLGVLLDLKMRALTNDQVSLQDLFHWMNEHYAKQGKFFPDSEGVRLAAETLTHADFREFFQKYVTGTDEFPWDRSFDRVGLRVTRSEVTLGDPGFEAARIFDQPLKVIQVQPGSNAERAGLKAEDIILQANGQSGSREIERVIAQLKPGDSLQLKVQRGATEQELRWVLSRRTRTVFRFEDVPDISPAQKSRRAGWLFGAAPNSQPTK